MSIQRSVDPPLLRTTFSDASGHKARISSKYILKCFVDISSIHVLRRFGFDGPARRFSVEGRGGDIFRCYFVSTGLIVIFDRVYFA